jgi:hypothetical protein
LEHLKLIFEPIWSPFGAHLEPIWSPFGAHVAIGTFEAICNTLTFDVTTK